MEVNEKQIYDMEIKAPIFNIQTLCIHDGPGIRVTVFVKGCPLRCIWCANPESNEVAAQLMTYAGRCTGCGQCMDVCRQQAIVLQKQEGRRIAATDHGACQDCGQCVSVCQNGAREIVGKMRTVSEVLEVILQDKLFLDASGGGMTISGGEALAHPEFSRALFCACQRAGIHTAIESCVFASREVIDRVFAHVDLGLLDIKHMDPGEHERLTGVPNGQILSNIKYIYHERKVPVIIRVPVIPGKNDGISNIRAVGEFVSEELGRQVPVHLLPYHQLGLSKYEGLGRPFGPLIRIPEKEHMERLQAEVESYGLQVQIGG